MTVFSGPCLTLKAWASFDWYPNFLFKCIFAWYEELLHGRKTLKKQFSLSALHCVDSCRRRAEGDAFPDSVRSNFDRAHRLLMNLIAAGPSGKVREAEWQYG